MPFNSFEDYPLTWKINKGQLKPPLYLSIADALETDIKEGVLLPNTKLPPQRELADYLDINLSTISKAFKICEMKGLIYAIVGRGTFVAPHLSAPTSLTDPSFQNEYIDFSQIRPFYQFNEIVLEVARSIMLRANADRLFEYNSSRDNIRYQTAGQKWLKRFHMEAPLENIQVTSGTQNALVIALLSFFKAGDKIAIDSYSYPNFISLAKLLNIQLIAVESDEYGMRPDVLELNCKTNGIKGIYLVPSCANPTTIVIPQERRKEIAEVIMKQNLILIEDDTYAFLASELIPISCYAPNRYIYISGTSKALCAGLKVAFISFSDQLKESILRGMQNVDLRTPLLNLEIVRDLIEGTTASELVTRRIELSQKRNAIYKKYFQPAANANPLSYFQWIPLPKGCNGYNFELQAKKAGLLLFCSDRFAIGPPQDRAAIRISTCSVQNNLDLETGLQRLQTLINENIVPDNVNNSFIV